MNIITFRALSIVVVVVASGRLCQAVSPIEPFVGQFSEGFESFRPGEIVGPVDILNGQGVLSGVNPTYPVNPFYVWESFGGFSLDDLTVNEGHVVAAPFDGTQGLSLQTVLSVDPIARIDFQQPVKDFGGYWVHAVTSETNGPITLTLFGAAGSAIASVEIVYDYAGLQGESQWFGWSSDVPIHAITFTGPWAGVDGIQINVVPEPNSMLMLLVASLALVRAKDRH